MTTPAAPPPAGPAGRRTVQGSARSSAPVAEVWPLIGEARRWKEWSFLTRSELVRPGHREPDGVGAVRRFTRFGIGSQEEVLAWDPPHHLAYTILKGYPVRNYRADVTLTPDGSGTLISWVATFDDKIPGAGSLMTAVTSRMIKGFASDVAAFADRHQAG